MSNASVPSPPTSKRSELASFIWSYLAYTRPLTLPVTFVLIASGYGLTVDGGRPFAQQAADLVILFLMYSVFGWGGANAINSSQDRDTGPVNLLPHPPPLPPHLLAFGVVWSLGALPLTAALGGEAIAVTAAMFALSLFYSVKRRRGTRGKDVAGVDVAVHAVGSGLLTIMLGASAADALDGRALAWGMIFAVALVGGFPTTQVFQLDDAQPGERNFTQAMGPARALRCGAVCFAAHAVAVVVAVAVFVDPAAFGSEATRWRLALLASGLGLVAVAAVHSWRWARAPGERAQQRMQRQLAIMLASQIAIVVACWGA
jgi:hypothetical protein